jgi:hypothetical protein
MNPPETITGSSRHAGPHLGLVAIVFAALKFASLIPVSAFGFAVGIKPSYFPGPAAPANDIVAYFDTHRLPVLICAFFQLGATVPRGIFTATIVSRLQFLGTHLVHDDRPGPGFLVPLTRFPGFVWLIAVGFLLPATIGERIGNRHQIA